MFLRFFISLAFFLSIGPLAHKVTDGFALANIHPPPFSHQAKAPPLNLAAIDRLKQTFTYFAKGGQCYVFIGEDEKTLLKVFKFQHMRVPPALDFPLWLKDKRKRKQAVFLEAMHSTALSMRHLAKETGLIGVHLAPSKDLPQSLTLIDKLGTAHLVNPQTLYFILQEKAEPLTADVKVAKQAMNLIDSLSYKGIVDKDPNYETNFGILNGRVIQFDVGRFVDEGGGLKPQEVAKLYQSIQDYFNKYAPNDAGVIRQEINRRLKNI